ncbi:MAG: hypothetical protein ACE5G8_07005 [Anaerolineae bacterium]
MLIGLGVTGAKTTGSLLTELARWLGEVGIVRGVAVVAEEMRLKNVESPLLIISPEATFETWRGDFDKQVGSALRQISQLNNLTQLAQQGIVLRRQDEVHLIVIANPAESWVRQALTGLTDALRHTVDRTLACHVGISGVLRAHVFVGGGQTWWPIRLRAER